MSLEQCVILLESEDIKQLDLMSKEKKRTRSALVRQAVSEFLSKEREIS